MVEVVAEKPKGALNGTYSALVTALDRAQLHSSSDRFRGLENVTSEGVQTEYDYSRTVDGGVVLRVSIPVGRRRANRLFMTGTILPRDLIVDTKVSLDHRTTRSGRDLKPPVFRPRSFSRIGRACAQEEMKWYPSLDSVFPSLRK